MTSRYPAGEVPARENASLREDRIYDSSGTRSREQRILELMAPFRRTNFPMAAPVRDFDATVRAALAGVEVRNARPHAFSLREIKDVYAKMPFSVREEAKAGVRRGFELAAVMPLAKLLKRSTGWEPDMESLARNAGKDRLFEKMAENVDDATGGFLPTSLVQGLPQAIAYALVAVASNRPEQFAKAEAFIKLFRAGNVPVGVLTDNTFLMMVL